MQPTEKVGLLVKWPLVALLNRQQDYLAQPQLLPLLDLVLEVQHKASPFLEQLGQQVSNNDFLFVGYQKHIIVIKLTPEVCIHYLKIKDQTTRCDSIMERKYTLIEQRCPHAAITLATFLGILSRRFWYTDFEHCSNLSHKCSMGCGQEKCFTPTCNKITL